MYTLPDISEILDDEYILKYHRTIITHACQAGHLKRNGLDRKIAYGMIYKINVALTKLHYDSISNLSQTTNHESIPQGND